MTKQVQSQPAVSSAEPHGDMKDDSATSEDAVKCYRFEELAAGNATVRIELQGATYTLRRTKAGGLILNK